MTAWTFETLAAADRKTLEEVLLAGPPPDFDQLEGYIYCGWNHEWVGRLSGEKFKKGFRKREGRQFGYNEIVRQDRQGYRGEWEVELRDGRPIQVGYFRVGLIKDEPPQRLYRPYTHAGHFNYNVELNTWRNLPFRVIRDMVVLPNPGDHSLMLCKAYFQLGFRWLNLFYCYFLLGHRREIEHEPW
ncbi:MAG: hypothetical protein ACRDLD_08460 [Thermoleophilaceae bacterium]